MARNISISVSVQDQYSQSISSMREKTVAFNKDIEEINKILEYRSAENKFFNSILQTKEDPYETIFNISYDVENSSKVFLKIYAMNENFILDYNL